MLDLKVLDKPINIILCYLYFTKNNHDKISNTCTY